MSIVILDAARLAALPPSRSAVNQPSEAGNTQYDPVSHRVFVAVQSRNQLKMRMPVHGHTCRPCPRSVDGARPAPPRKSLTPGRMHSAPPRGLHPVRALLSELSASSRI